MSEDDRDKGSVKIHLLRRLLSQLEEEIDEALQSEDWTNHFHQPLKPSLSAMRKAPPANSAGPAQALP